MPTTVAQAEDPSTLVVDAGRFWVTLDTAVDALQAKVEAQNGQRVLCRKEQCVLLSPEVLRSHGQVEFVDVLWLADALGLADQPSNRFDALLATNVTGDSQLAPDFTLPTLDGSARSLSDFRGRKTAVYIWGSW